MEIALSKHVYIYNPQRPTPACSSLLLSRHPTASDFSSTSTGDPELAADGAELSTRHKTTRGGLIAWALLWQVDKNFRHSSPTHYLSLYKREKGAEMARIVTSSHAIARRSCRSRVSADARLFPHASRPRRYLFPDRRGKGPEMARIVAFSQVPRRSCRST